MVPLGGGHPAFWGIINIFAFHWRADHLRTLCAPDLTLSLIYELGLKILQMYVPHIKVNFLRQSCQKLESIRLQTKRHTDIQTDATEGTASPHSWVVPRSSGTAEIARAGITSFKVIQGHWFWYDTIDIVWFKTRFDILNRPGVDHKCNGQTDGRTGGQNRC